MREDLLLIALALPLAANGCGGKALDYRTVYDDGGAGSAGSAGVSGASGASGNAGGSGVSYCSTVADCPAAVGPCAFETCEGGVCGVAYVVEGTFLEREAPANCLMRVCGRMGDVSEVADPGNVPASQATCMENSCDSNGAVVAQFSVAGAPCANNGGTLCDGAGACVACLSASDCASAQSCTANGTCAAATCFDGVRNGTESDVDCGGACAGCALGQSCEQASDCLSLLCDPTTGKCGAPSCADDKLDGDEPSRDCGGSCSPCDDDDACKLDADCKSGKCDPLFFNRCLPKSCMNGVQDLSETDVDCGGGNCVRCAVGQKCNSELDCLGSACDGISHTCSGDHCHDSAFDSNETDQDCGGPDCAGCGLGLKCTSSSDCAPGLTCQGYIAHQCLPPQ